MKHTLLALSLLLSLPIRAITPTAEVIDACVYSFYGNTKHTGFDRYDANGVLIRPVTNNEIDKLDYVPGLVAKGLIEAAEYYRNPEWFYAVRAYGMRYADEVETTGVSLDNLNAVKLYIPLARLTARDGLFPDEKTHAVALEAMEKAAQGLGMTDSLYSISRELSVARTGDERIAGVWWHKKGYPNQMWCDGQYMGPALLSELLTAGITLPGRSERECWDIVAHQLLGSWQMLWDEDKHLLRHAYSATPKEELNRTSDWANLETGLSQEYWGRACGWYFLALVDVLEHMPQQHPAYGELRYCLQRLAEGLADRQDESGCWYQLLAYDRDLKVTAYPAAGVHDKAVHNYLESSCTAIFTAAYLKAIRLGLLDRAFLPVAERGYQGFLKHFLHRKEQGVFADGNSVLLSDCCRSAGLGGKSNKDAKTRDGSAAYYLLGYDVQPTTVNDYTEGKVLGAFLLATLEHARLADNNEQ